MAKIIAPVKGHTGESVAGVMFTNGVAETDNQAAIAYFLRRGYTVEQELVLSQPFPDGEPDKSWKSAELKHYAAAHEIDIAGASNKDEILAAIVAAAPASPDGVPSDEDTEQ